MIGVSSMMDLDRKKRFQNGPSNVSFFWMLTQPCKACSATLSEEQAGSS